MKLKGSCWLVAVFLLFPLIVPGGHAFAAWVIREDGRVYIEDRIGERWDVTEAEKMGFVPAEFQYGIGKNAFTPLGDEDFAEDNLTPPSSETVFGESAARISTVFFRSWNPMIPNGTRGQKGMQKQNS